MTDTANLHEAVHGRFPEAELLRGPGARCPFLFSGGWHMEDPAQIEYVAIARDVYRHDSELVVSEEERVDGMLTEV